MKSIALSSSRCALILLMLAVGGASCTRARKDTSAAGLEGSDSSANPTTQQGSPPPPQTAPPEVLAPLLETGMLEVLFETSGIWLTDEVLVGDKWLFWTEGGGVRRGHKTGKQGYDWFTPAPGLWHATMQLAQDEKFIYWVENDIIRQVDKESAESTDFPFGDLRPSGGALVVHQGTAYLADSGCLHLAVVPLGEGTAVTAKLAPLEKTGGQTSLTVDAAGVYCASGATGFIHRYEVATGKVTLLAELDHNFALGGVATTDEHLYWIQHRRALQNEQWLYRANKATGTDVTIVVAVDGNINERLVHRDGVLYWSSGGVKRFSISQKEYTKLTPLGNFRADVAVDEKYVYFARPGFVFRGDIARLQAASTVQ